MGMSKQWVVGSSDEMGATIENDDGYDVVRIERLGQFVGDGTLRWVHRDLERSEAQKQHATTDAQWRAIVDDIALTPEIIACLREVAYELPAIAGITAKTEQWIRELVRKTRHKATVHLTVEVEVEEGEDGHAELHMRAVDRMRDGYGVVISSNTVG
jgi:hypothetical protein